MRWKSGYDTASASRDMKEGPLGIVVCRKGVTGQKLRETMRPIVVKCMKELSSRCSA